MWKKQISKIPDRYILKRWTIDCRYQSVDVGFGNDVVASEVDRELLWGIRYKCNKVLEKAYKSPAFAEEIDKYLTRKLAEVDDGASQGQNSQVDRIAPTLSQYSSNTIPEINIRDPTEAARTKGRPRQPSRFHSGLETSQEEATKKRKTCGHCGEKGHYRTGCPIAKEIERQERGYGPRST
ncbi:hypothetical protein OROGR_028313 [Orobanche gracilis]